MTTHIGILQTDRVLDEFREDHGDYPDMFQRLFSDVDRDVIISSFWVQDVAQLPGDTACDAYLITGSRHSVYDELPWIPPLVDFLQTVLDARKKIIGVCFGHQLMAHYFGGRVAAAPQGWAVGVHQSRMLRRAPWMKTERGAPGPGTSTELGAVTERADQIALLSSHKDQVMELPEGAELFATNEFCPIAGFTVGDSVITVQGHPEFSATYAQALMDMRRDLLGDTVYRRGVASLACATDQNVFARWLLQFVRGAADG